jgi:hypothetical protein
LKQQYQLAALEVLAVNQDRLESLEGQLAAETSVGGAVKETTIGGYVVLVSQFAEQLTGLSDIWAESLKENHQFTVEVSNLFDSNLTAFVGVKQFIEDNLAVPYSDYVLNGIQLDEALAIQETQVKYRDALAKAVDDLQENIELQKKSVEQTELLGQKAENLKLLLEYEKSYATIQNIKIQLEVLHNQQNTIAELQRQLLDIEKPTGEKQSLFSQLSNLRNQSVQALTSIVTALNGESLLSQAQKHVLTDILNSYHSLNQTQTNSFNTLRQKIEYKVSNLIAIKGAVDYKRGNGASSSITADFNGDGLLDVFNYHPGTGNALLAQFNGQGGITQVFNSQGVAGYDLKSGLDQALAFDYNGDGKQDLFFYRPGRGAAFVSRSNGDGSFSTVYAVGDDGAAGLNGIAGYDLLSGADRALAFDYNGDGKQDLFFYRPGRGAAFV